MFQKRSIREPGKMINLAVMLALAMHVKESKYANNAHFNTASGKPIGVDNRCSG